MNMQPVTSSSIDAVGYHQDTRTLHVRFASGATYEYRNVDPEEHAALIEAKSIGAHFAANIRNQYKGVRQ